MSEKKTKKIPLSLNQRNNRMIDDFSASQPRKPPQPTPATAATAAIEHSKFTLDGKRRLFKGSTGPDRRLGAADATAAAVSDPQFSEVADFDYSLIERDTEKQVKVKVEGRRRLCKVSSGMDDDDDDDCGAGRRDGHDEPKFSLLDDFDSPLSEKNRSVGCKSGGDVKKDEANEPSFSILSDFDSEKIKGKSSGSSGNGKKAGIAEPSINDYDFDSPARENVPSKSNVGGGGNEIRDILNDLTSKFDILSIERKRIPKTVDSIEDHVDVKNNKEVKKHENGEGLPDYESASSSFSHKSDGSDSSSDPTNQTVAGGVVDNNVEVNLLGEADNDLFVSEINETKNEAKKPVNKEIGRLAATSNFGATSFVSKVVDDDSDDECVVLSNKTLYKHVERGKKQLVEASHLSDGLREIDDCADNSDSKGDGSITLKGPKYTFKLSGKIGKMLYPHQRDGMKWLWSLHCQGKGGILGDDMGLGKTMQMCGFMAGLFSSGLIKRVMVVAPTTLLPHWIKELSTVGLSDKTREYFGTSLRAREYDLHHVLQNKGILLTTYDLVRNNSKALRGDYFSHGRDEDETTWDYMILDEGHLIKNPSTQRAKSLLEIPSAHRIIISGTPIQNNLKELWALFNFCCPDLLSDKTWFKETYENPILRGNDKKASDREKRIGSTVAKDLRDRIQPYFLRRLKSEVFGDDDTKTGKLSKKNEMIVWLRLTSCQRQLYEAFLNSEIVLSAFDGSPLAAITESLVTRGYEYMRIDGTTKSSDRLKIVNDFQEGNGAPIFLLTSQVGGLGLTLTKADRVIVVDPAWNPSTDSQSVDRAYRIGQKKDVIVYRLMTCGTVEEKIYRKQIYKGGLFKCATEHKEHTRYFSQQDLKDLFRLPEQGFDISLTQQQLHEEHDSQHKMDKVLTDHIKFLETQGIAGVSHHSLLFSKTAPVPVGGDEEEEVARNIGHSYVGRPSASSSNEGYVDGAEFAFNPKDVKLYRHSTSTDSGGKLTETDIKDRIHRLSLIYENKATISKLPDKGQRIQKQIAELHLELDNIQTAKRNAREVIDLDDITGSLKNAFNI